MPRSLVSALRVAGERCRAFFLWWCAELDELMLDAADRWGSRWRRTLEVKIIGDTLDLTWYRRSHIERHEVWPRAFLEAPEDDRWHTLPPRASLEIPHDWGLWLVVEFPAAAREQLRSAIELRLARVSPLPPKEVYWTHKVIASDPSRVTASLALVRRRPVDHMVHALARCGISVSSLEVQAGGSAKARIALDSRTPLAQTTVRRVNGALTALSVVALLTVAYASHARLTRTHAALDAEYQKVRSAAARDWDLRASLEHEELALASLRAHLPPSPGSVLLAALQQSLPPPIWLQSLQIKGREAHLTLYVPPRAEVDKLLLENPNIQSVTENSRVSLGVGITEERVELFVVLTEPSA